jgi:hypothetical protein
MVGGGYSPGMPPSDRHIFPSSRRELLAQWPMALLTVVACAIVALTVTFGLGH